MPFGQFLLRKNYLTGLENCLAMLAIFLIIISNNNIPQLPNNALKENTLLDNSR